jgi:hypothetical protein
LERGIYPFIDYSTGGGIDGMIAASDAQTDVLIVGELGWPLLDDGRPSNSLVRAKSYRVLIASERQFLQWLGKSALNCSELVITLLTTCGRQPT